MTGLGKKILITIAYYDVLDYPMTSFELWKYMISHNMKHETHNEKKEYSLVDIVKELESEDLKNKIEEFRGFYFLNGRKDLVSQRLERNKIAEKKFKRVKKIVWILRIVPFVKMIAVTGRLAMKNTEKSSDLDLLVVLKKGHIFTGRTLVTLITHLLGARRYGRKIANRICLNFFITDQSLKINIKDLFSSSEYYFIWPLYGYGTFRRFQAENDWVGAFRENYWLEETANVKMLKDNFIIRMFRGAWEQMLSLRFIEGWLKKWQTGRIIKDPRTHINGSMVMADDSALIFLPEPQGPGVFERFQEKMRELNV